jgi:APA family basic amino acid/polyamine antiporter
VTAINTDNFTPVAPTGFDGVVAAASIIFFAYIGFGAVSTGSEEARNHSRVLLLAIIG